jgi:phosphatidylinositol alpha-1,6-mannosyltransferase
LTNKILFLTLKVFAATGGIEKVCRVAGKSIYEMTHSENYTARIFSMYDKPADASDNKYFPSEMFKGFGTAKARFVYAALNEGRKSNTVILSHINLLLVGWLIKKISPSTKIVMFAHGIEVWEKLGKRKKMMLHCCDKIISVSNFTSQKIQELHAVNASRCTVLNNSLDPFLPVINNSIKKSQLRSKYGYTTGNKIIFTLTRLSSRERYKGYDKVMEALLTLKKLYPEIRYLLAGSYDEKEKEYLDKMIADLKLEKNVHIAGFIPEESLVEHFSIADIYVMPSMKEGFGIVFIEAMYYGVPVIAGNKDGSVDALCNGELGILVNPLNVTEIEKAMEKILANKKDYIPDQQLLMKHFSYDQYKLKLEKVITDTVAGV